MSLQVIGAGLSRTGTLSLKTALETLGFGPCYHMIELLKHPDRTPYWEQAERGEAVDWEGLFAGYQAAVDYPTYRYLVPLLARYPAAKVILTVRDPEDWYASTLATLYQASTDHSRKLKIIAQMPFSAKIRRLVPALRLSSRVWDLDFGGHFTDKDYALTCFQAHIQHVKAVVPADRLLIYRVSSGWDPLCQFLQVPVPEQSFPWLSRRSQFGSRLDWIVGQS